LIRISERRRIGNRRSRDILREGCSGKNGYSGKERYLEKGYSEKEGSLRRCIWGEGYSGKGVFGEMGIQ